MAAASITAKIPTLQSRIPDNSQAASLYRRMTNSCPLSMYVLNYIVHVVLMHWLPSINVLFCTGGAGNLSVLVAT